MHTENAIEEIIQNFQNLKKQSKEINIIAKTWIQALEQGKKILFCGNGGSAADCQHLSTELIGRYKLNRPALASVSLTTDTSALTAIGNDFGFEEIFARQVEGLGQEGDVLVGISTSGNSKNILSAFEMAKKKKMNTIAFTGQTGGQMKNIADICFCVPSTITNNIQEMHIATGHILCDLVEKHFFADKK